MINTKRQEAGRLNALKRWGNRDQIIKELQKFEEDKDWLDWFQDNMDTATLRRVLGKKLDQKNAIQKIKRTVQNRQS